MVNMNDLIQFTILIAVAAMLGGAAAIALGAFEDTQVTGAAGCNSTDTSSCGYAYNVSETGSLGLLNVSGQFATIGTIVGVAVLIGIVIAAFRFAR